MIEEIVESVGSLEDREAFVEDDKELPLDFFQGLLFDV